MSDKKLSQLPVGTAVQAVDLIYCAQSLGGGLYTQVQQPMSAIGTYLVAASTPTANPTGTIGLTAVNGVAVTAMRSDAAQPLDVSIAPTWTGFHEFSAGFRTGTAEFVVNTDGRAGFGVAPSPNMWLKIGTGTGGSLVDTNLMGLKVRLDADASHTIPAAIQANINLPAGLDVSAASNVVGVVGRVDDRGTTGTTSIVGIWGDSFIRGNSARNAWGINAYVEIDPGVIFTGNAVNELGIFNNVVGTTALGGPLHCVSGGTDRVQFGMRVSGVLEHAIQIKNDAEGPSVNAFYYGAITAGFPTGTPQFTIDKLGNTGIGLGASTATWLGLASSTTAKAQINLPIGSAPTAPIDGDIWRENNTTNGLKVRVNGVTQTVSLATVPSAQRSITAASPGMPSITIAPTDQMINCNVTSGAAPTCTLPLASTRAGLPLTFKDVGGQFATRNLTLTPTGPDLIDGLSSYVLRTNYSGVRLVPLNDGVNSGWSIG